ncbi:hypothetical protein BGZ65_011950, partial [Modicella reniformis]
SHAQGQAVKNETEQEGMCQCHLRGSATLINYLAWLEEQLANGVELDEADGAARINPDLIYLCDAGGQYIDGTTDVTRILYFQLPSDHKKRCFARVLQGHIAIDTAVFPDDTSGYLLDILARRTLWADGLDFRHGTGHGVGAFLNVHEGPRGCGTRIVYNDIPLDSGMTLTN